MSKLITRAGIAQWLEHWTRDWKVTDSNPHRSSGRFSSPGSTFCVDSYFGICSTPMLHIKDPGHSAKSADGRLQLNTHTPYICGFAWSDMEQACMVCTEPASRWLQFYVYQPWQHCKYTTSVDIQKTCYKKLVTHVEPHVSAVSLLKRAENSTI